MPKRTSKGNCYICGANLGNAAMEKHILENHGEENGGQECRLLKIEGRYEKEYWLYIDVPVERSLSDIDKFLRKIWLECCGHLSMFSLDSFGTGEKINKTRKLETFYPGDKFFHLYDFGSTTEAALTVIGNTLRKPQKNAVRLLARNTPPVFSCEDCGKEAVDLCEEIVDTGEMCFVCADCGEKYADENHFFHVITNSPRMGVCAYDGELDCYGFQPALVKRE